MAYVPINTYTLKIFYQKLWVDGVFDLNNVIKEVRDWFAENNYLQPKETENTTKVRGQGIETILKFKAEREVTEYIKFLIMIDGRTIETEKVKMDGKTLDKGKAEFKVETWIELDYKNKWKKRALGRIFMYIYNNFIIKDKLDGVYDAKLYNEGFDLFNTIKRVLNLYT